MEHHPDTQYKGKFDRMRIYGKALNFANVLALYHQDIDRDGLWDITENATRIWRDKNSNGYQSLDEMNYFISPYRYNDQTDDFDEDKLSSVQEQTEGTNIVIADSDGDGMPDGWEVLYNLDPLDPDDADLDKEEDGLSNLLEYYNASNPDLSDSDEDETDDFLEYTQGSLAGDGTDGGDVIPPDESLTINLGVGDQSGSDSENYDLKVYKIDPVTGDEVYYFTHPSGGNGEYDEKLYSKFRKDETYTFQIFWMGTNLGSQTATNPDGADFDYTFKVEPQNDENGLVIDQYDPELKRVDETKPIQGNKNNVDTFKQTVQKKRVGRVAVKFDLWMDTDMDTFKESNTANDTLDVGYFGRTSQDEQDEEEEYSVIIDINNNNTDKGSGSTTANSVDNTNDLLDQEADRDEHTDTTKPGHTFASLHLVAAHSQLFNEKNAKYKMVMTLEDTAGQVIASDQIIRVFRWDSYDDKKSKPKAILGPGKTEYEIPYKDFFQLDRRKNGMLQKREFFVEGITGGFALIHFKLVNTETQAVKTDDTVRVTVNVDRVAYPSAVAATKKDAEGIKGKYPHYIGVRKSSIEGNVSSPLGVRALRGRIIARPPSYKKGASGDWATQVSWMHGRELRQFYNVNTETSGSSFWIGLKQTLPNGGVTWTQCGLRWIQRANDELGSDPFAYLETGTALPAQLGGQIPFNRTLAAPADESQNDGGNVQQNKAPLQGWESGPLILDFVLYKLPGETDANGSDVTERPWRVIFRDSRAGKSASIQSNYISMDLSTPMPTGSVGSSVSEAFRNAYKAQKMGELDIQFETNQSISFVPGSTSNPAEMKNLYYSTGLTSGSNIDSRPNDFNDLVAYYNWAATTFQWQAVTITSSDINRQIRTGKRVFDYNTQQENVETINQHPWWNAQVQGNALKLWDTRAWGFGREVE